MSNSGLLEELRGRELRGGGWSFFGARQVSLEATPLAILCLLAERPSKAPRLGKLLSDVQLADGSWPSFVGDRESSWTTALSHLRIEFSRRSVKSPRTRRILASEN
jgi:hypothetical protein